MQSLQRNDILSYVLMAASVDSRERTSWNAPVTYAFLCAVSQLIKEIDIFRRVKKKKRLRTYARTEAKTIDLIVVGGYTGETKQEEYLVLTWYCTTGERKHSSFF